MLGVVLHAPRGPFYSPKEARSRSRSIWKAILAFCRVAHRTVRCTTGHELSLSGARSPSFLAKPTVAPSVILAHRTLSGAHRTVRCDQVIVGSGHVLPVDRGRPLAVGAVCSPDSSVRTGQSGEF
jgi:hypothetical protein